MTQANLEADSVFERLGDLEFPFRAPAPGALGGLASLDPSRDLLLELFQSAINSELGPAWAQVIGNLGGQRENLGLQPVSDVLPEEPTEQLLRQRKSTFPLLAIHRSGTATYESFTLEITRLVQPWTLHYILGPLDIIDGRQLKDICVAVAKLVALVIRKRGHQSFQGGALQFFGELAADQPSPLSSLRLVNHEGPGQAVFGSDGGATMYWAIEMHLESGEISSYVEDGQACALDAADINAGAGTGGEILPAVVLAATDNEA
jgi:hypothetical protein